MGGDSPQAGRYDQGVRDWRSEVEQTTGERPQTVHRAPGWTVEKGRVARGQTRHARRTLVHVPPIPNLTAADPELAGLIEPEARRQHDKLRMIASENYVSAAVLEATGTVLTNKYSEGYAGKRYYEGQQFIDPIEALAIERAQGAVRRRPRQRPAVLRLARQPRRLPRLPEPRRHGDGHGPADGRPPHPRLVGLGDRQVVPPGPLRRVAARPAGSTWTRSATSRCGSARR